MTHTFRQHRALIQRIEQLREHDLQSTATTLQGTVGRELTEICAGLDELRRQLSNDSKHVELLARIDAVAGQAREDLRRLVHAIQPPGTDDLGLVPALERCVADYSAVAGTTSKLHFYGRLPTLTREKRTVLHRVLEEALANIARHARARHVDVRLTADEYAVFLQVRDDGVGMTECDRQKPGALGLFALNERLAGCGGSLHLRGGAGRGTVLEATVPAAQRMPSAAAEWDPSPYQFEEYGSATAGTLRGS